MEDTELFALSSQVTTRLKELSQLKWDSQSTERIEITKICFEETKTAFSPHNQPTDPPLVGEIHTDTYEPTLQLIFDAKPHSVENQQDNSASFQITAVVKFNGKEKNANLIGSARYTCTKKSYYSYQQRQSFIQIEQGADANSWIVKFTPPKAGSCRITFTAQGKYGNKTLYNQYSCTVDARLNFKQEEPPENDYDEQFSRQQSKW